MNKTDTSEKGLEDIIVETLVTKGPFHYVQGTSDDYRADLALDVARMMAFLKTTQPKAFAKLQLETSEKKREDFLTRLDGEITKRGVIDVLRNGIRCYPSNETVYLYYIVPKPNEPDTLERWKKNVFSVTRQLRHLGAEKGDAVDLCIFVNGLPILTCELKNQYTNQNWRDAEKQYRKDRDPKSCKLFRFKRCMAHFAVDDNEVRFQTKLDGPNTGDFLPFNKGCNDGAGNPPNPDGVKTDYFWQVILQPINLSHIIEYFAQVIVEENKKTGKKVEKQIFPRYHQFDCVMEILKRVYHESLGGRYLIEHSAGSGKSNTIAWLVHQLAGWGNSKGKNAFDSVIVVTDRVNLDKQIRDTVKQFSKMANTVGWANKSGTLKKFLEDGKRIIITTIHKFGVIHDEIQGTLKDHSFAIVIDEAHSSQSGDLSAKMNGGLAGDAWDEDDDAETKILKIMESRQMLKNASYFAFTATPKKRTLEMFGTKVVEGGKVMYRPCHVYTMKQAIEEKFILNVLENYTPYSSFYKIAKTIDGNPKFDKERSQKKIAAYVQSAKPTIDRKAAIIVEHFHTQVAHLIRREARAMVVCKDIERAINYFTAIQALLKERQSPYRAIVAFSGEKLHDGDVVTEEKLNGFPSSEIEDTFASGPYRILVVANKFQTGFDEPLLSAMYVDKKLADVQAVQTLSRLNRCHRGKFTTFVLDFAENQEAVQAAFSEYYRDTFLNGETDPNKLFDLQSGIEAKGVFSKEEVLTVVDGVMDGVARPMIDAVIDPCVERYKALCDEEKIAFKSECKHFVRLYSFLATLLPCGNPEWERLFVFLKLLVPKLPSPDDPDLTKGLLETVDLDSYRIQAQEAMNLLKDAGPGVLEPEQACMGHGKKEPEVDSLDAIISEFNALSSNIAWSDKDRVIKLATKVIPAGVAASEAFINAFNYASPEAQQLESDHLVEQFTLNNMADGIEIFKQYADNPIFKLWLNHTVLEQAKKLARAKRGDYWGAAGAEGDYAMAAEKARGYGHGLEGLK